MAIEICPLASDWGSVADWAAVFVGAWSLAVAMVAAVIALLGAAAVAYLAWQANRQVGLVDAENADVRGREADVLKVLFEPEIGVLGVAIGTCLGFVSEDGDYKTNPQTRQLFARKVKLLALPAVEAHFDRLHVLPGEICHAIARLRGRLGVLQVMADATLYADSAQIDHGTPLMRDSCEEMRNECRRLNALLKARRKELLPTR